MNRLVSFSCTPQTNTIIVDIVILLETWYIQIEINPQLVLPAPSCHFNHQRATIIIVAMTWFSWIVVISIEIDYWKAWIWSAPFTEEGKGFWSFFLIDFTSLLFPSHFHLFLPFFSFSFNPKKKFETGGPVNIFDWPFHAYRLFQQFSFFDWKQNRKQKQTTNNRKQANSIKNWDSNVTGIVRNDVFFASVHNLYILVTRDT